MWYPGHSGTALFGPIIIKMKFINYLEKISGVSIYPVISLLLFTAVFVLVIIYAMRASRDTIAEMENIPLDDQ